MTVVTGTLGFGQWSNVCTALDETSDKVIVRMPPRPKSLISLIRPLLETSDPGIWADYKEKGTVNSNTNKVNN